MLIRRNNHILRVFLAALLAVLLHVGLFFVNPGWISGQAVRPPRSTAVTVSMSYRQPPVPKEKDRAKKQKQTAEKKPQKKLPEKKPEKKKAPDKSHPEPQSPKEETPVKKKVPEPPSSSEKTEGASADEQATEKKSAKKTTSRKHQKAEKNDLVSDTHGKGRTHMKVTREAVPMYKSNPPPRYPKVARIRGYQGKVILSVHVNRNGRVDNIWVFDSSGHRILDKAALETVQKWYFEPGRKGEKKVAMWVKVPVTFQLK